MAGLLGTISGQVRLDIRQAVAAYATLRAENARTVYALRGTGDAFVATGQQMAVAGAGLVYVFGRAVKAAAEFERKMDFFGAVTATTADEMKRLETFTLDLAESTIYSAGQIAEGFIELGKAGVSATQIMEGIGEAMANLGAAGDIPLTKSGQIITSTIQQFDLAASDAVKVTDLLAGAANASIADIDDIGVSLKYVGGVANAVGLSFEDTAVAISLLAKAGIRGSTAGTSLRQMLVSLGGATGPARDTLKDLGILLEDGTNLFFDNEGKAKSLAEVYQILQRHTADLTAKERLMALRTIFNNRALAAASILTREGAKGFREMSAEMAKTTAADVAAARLDNLSGDLEILRGNIETLMIQAGGPFQETLRGWVQTLTKLVQAFGELEPETQKMIVQFIGLSGLALVVSGVFAIIVGTIYRAVAAAKKLGAGIKFLVKNLKTARLILGLVVRLLGTSLLAALGITGGALLVIVGVIAAVGVAFYIAYKKIEPFRDFINKLGSSIGSAVKAIGAFFKALATDPGSVWESIKQGFASALEYLRTQVSRVGSFFAQGFNSARDKVSGFIDSVVGFFRSLPGRILSLITNFASFLVDTFSFKNIGFVLSTFVGTVVTFFMTLGPRIITLALRMVTGLISTFGQLAPKVGYVIGFMVGRFIRLMIFLAARAISLTVKIVSGILNFFQKLPGRIQAFGIRMAIRFLGALRQMVAWARENGPKIVAGIIDFVATLPQRIFNFAVKMAARLVTAIPRMLRAAGDFGQGLVDGIMNLVNDLPGLVGDALDNVIQAFRDLISTAFNAAKDFAGGLWNGFRDGLGINSPSFIEKHMVQMTSTVGSETKRLRKQVLDVQKAGKNLSRTNFGVGLEKAVSTVATGRRLGEGIGRDLALTRPSTPANVAIQQPEKTRLVEGTLDLHPNGRVTIQGLAQDIYDDNEGFYSSGRRAGRR